MTGAVLQMATRVTYLVAIIFLSTLNSHLRLTAYFL